MADARARYWGVLNQWRGLTARTYDEHVALQTRSVASSWWIPRLVLAGISLFPLTITVGVLTQVPEHPSALVPAAVFGVPGGILLYFAVRLHRSIGRRNRARGAYRAAQPERDGWYAVLERLAVAWDGTVESTGTGPAVRWLIRHWPDRAPTLPLFPVKSEEQRRSTVTGTLRGYPVMLQVIDFWPALPALDPPVLYLLVARPLEQADPALTDAGQSLAAAGFAVGATRAGVWVHRGSATALLSDEEELARVADLAVDLCTELPAGEPVPEPDPVEQPGSAEQVAVAFLNALAARDRIGTLALTDPGMFVGQELEPVPRDIDRAVDAAHARPVRWESVRLANTLKSGDTHLRFTGTANVIAPASVPISLYLTDRSSRWLVAGYSVRYRVVLGEDFPD